ncbi:hypothetical protein LTS15_001956 [Exophiala xenobiotica]|nr:hypothetical protein LTS15_001956 [Exophiala xenobiotica]
MVHMLFPKSCGFYRNCAEAELNCGASGYPLGFGEKNCVKFTQNLDWFDAAGQDFLFGTMNCLQKAMVPVLQTCSATCDSFRDAAFASHPGCYVGNGFCGLSCGDVLATVLTVGTDLFNSYTLQQIVGTAEGCAANLHQTLSGCAGEAILLGVNTIPATVGELLTNVMANYFK